MLLRRARQSEALFREFVRERFSLELGSAAAKSPPRIEFGDLAFAFPFELARSLRRAPRDIALEIAGNFRMPSWMERVEAAGGYVNIYLKRDRFLADLQDSLSTSPEPERGPKIIVEHTNINPNKAAHIGHLRNAVLGDTFGRLLRSRGHSVEIQNYIDDTGVQVADVVVGFQQLRELNLEQVRAIPEPFDYYCWDLYAQVCDWYGQEDSRLEHRRRTLREIEEGEGETSRMAEHISLRIVNAHLRTMWRIGVRYDVLPRESQILRERFWDEAFDRLKQRKAITHVADGPNRGCWVMRLPGENGQPAEEKIIVRSDGTVTYVGKDIAYQLWKFGLLDKNFRYRVVHRYPDRDQVWMTSSDGASDVEKDFGRGQSVYNVIDVRQSYLQRVVVHGLRSLGHEVPADHSTHFSYEMVALSLKCSQELGIELSEADRARPYVEVSGRKGLGVKADDLVDKLIEKSLLEVANRQPDLTHEARLRIATQIAVGSLRYFLLKYARNSVIAFDFGAALSFEGETGPYLQYSVVRANNIFRKLRSQGGVTVDHDQEDPQRNLREHPEQFADLLQDDQIWKLLLQAGRSEGATEQSLKTLEMSYLAKHAFSLAQIFNIFYHSHHILSQKDSRKQTCYLAVADTARRAMTRSLALLGIEVPERM